jgi:restriction endonuclease BglII
MPVISEEKAYNGAQDRVERLGLSGLLAEVRQLVTGFRLLVKEAKDANGGAAVRRLLDARFQASEGWAKRQTGDVDWSKCTSFNGARVCLGVEIQFSARSDLVVVDLIHLRKAIVKGRIDVGVLIVPSDRLGYFLTDRGPKLADAKRHVVEAKVEDLPLILIGLDHDGPGPPLQKQFKRTTAMEES